MEHSREIYNLLSLFGDLGGIFELLHALVALFFSQFLFNKFLLAKMKAHYFVNSKEKMLFSNKLYNQKAKKYKHSNCFEQETKNHQIIKVDIFKEILMTFMNCSGFCKNRAG